MEAIKKIIKQNEAVRAVCDQKPLITTFKEALLIEGAFYASQKTILIIKSNQYQADMLFQELSVQLGDVVHYFSSEESLRVELLAASPELLIQRLETLYAAIDIRPIIIVTHVSALFRYIPSKEKFENSILKIATENTFDMDALKSHLVDVGYQYSSKVDQPLYFAKRGGVIDVFSPNYINPIRIEFFDDEIESIRFYNQDTQHTIEHVNEVTILPASDLFYSDEKLDETISIIQNNLNEKLGRLDEIKKQDLENKIALQIDQIKQKESINDIYQYYHLLSDTTSLISYLNNPLILISDENAVKESERMYHQEMLSYQREMFEEGNGIDIIPPLHSISELIFPYKETILSQFETKNAVLFNIREVQPMFNNESIIIETIKEYVRNNRVVIALQHEAQINVIKTMLRDHQLKYVLLDDGESIYEGINIFRGSYPKGFYLVEEKLVVISEFELFNILKKAKNKFFSKYKEAQMLSDFNELKVGDFVVHEAHGIGQYLGIKTMEVQCVLQDYLYIAYKGNDTLYIPVDQFKLVRKYVSKEGTTPKVHKIGGSEWEKTKQRIKNRINDLADRLIALYAEREQQKGFAFSKDDDLQRQFEEDFDYPLTRDQEKSLIEIKQDMEASKPMDRLLCGDVGFGKTEVGLRAAFKAILDHKQVLFLCPTTILSNQHYQTAIQRFSSYPVEIRLLNRFTSTSERNSILKELKEGKVDLLIGTHRLLSKDVVTKDLGFLIVDEEQRFGVEHKEKIKEMKQNIDVLTLTATPIPRTLQMSLMGVRGLSQILTPPLNRLPVQTYVIPKKETSIKEIIERELSRKGQVFYLYNNVSELSSRARMIQKLVPTARIVVAHGQMSKDDLEDVMIEFTNKNYDVLVCTTIIETGIDIANANTILVEDADRFGLSQLYQIRGRVGRSERLAYAYLMYRPQKQLTEIATKRLNAIKEFTELGSGYKIAMRDLAIRGAGDILGPEQAGFIDTIGFDMYLKMIQDVIKEKQGIQDELDIPVNHMKVSAYLPNNYVDTDFEKLAFYQRIENAKTLNTLIEIEEELLDLYGRLPQQVILLIEKRKFDILIFNQAIDKKIDRQKEYEIHFTKDFSTMVDGVKLFDIVSSLSKEVRLGYRNQKIQFIIPKKGDWIILINQILISVLRSSKIVKNT